MTEDELRALVREVHRRTGARRRRFRPPRPPASHARLGMVVPTVAGSPCLIEPAR